MNIQTKFDVGDMCIYYNNKDIFQVVTIKEVITNSSQNLYGGIITDVKYITDKNEFNDEFDECVLYTKKQLINKIEMLLGDD